MPPAIPAPALITDRPTFVAVSRARPPEPEPDDENSPLSERDALLPAAREAPLRAARDAPLERRDAPLRALLEPLLREPEAEPPEPLLREPEPLLRALELPLRLAAVPELLRALPLRLDAVPELLRALADDELFFALEPLPDALRDRVEPPDRADVLRVDDALGSEPLPVDSVACDSPELSAPLDEDRWPDVRRPDFR